MNDKAILEYHGDFNENSNDVILKIKRVWDQQGKAWILDSHAHPDYLQLTDDLDKDSLVMDPQRGKFLSVNPFLENMDIEVDMEDVVQILSAMAFERTQATDMDEYFIQCSVAETWALNNGLNDKFNKAIKYLTDLGDRRAMDIGNRISIFGNTGVYEGRLKGLSELQSDCPINYMNLSSILCMSRLHHVYMLRSLHAISTAVLKTDCKNIVVIDAAKSFISQSTIQRAIYRLQAKLLSKEVTILLINRISNKALCRLSDVE